MSKNKSRKMQQAVRLCNQILEIEEDELGCLPGQVLSDIKSAKRRLLQHIRKRRDARVREVRKRG